MTCDIFHLPCQGFIVFLDLTYFLALVSLVPIWKSDGGSGLWQVRVPSWQHHGSQFLDGRMSLWLSIRLANGQLSAHYNHLMLLFTVITMYCWWGSLHWPCSWTSEPFKASDLYFWSACWRVEIELEPCFCGSPGCKVPQAQGCPLQVCGSEPT